MQDILHRLTRPHSIEITRDDGSTVIATAEPLLQQLREAIFGEDGRNGGTAQSRARLPLSAPALDLYQAIDDRISEVWAQRFQGIPGTERPEALLSSWADELTPETFVVHSTKRTVTTTRGTRVEVELVSTSALAFLMQMEDEIVALLERPTVQVPVVGPCPAIGCFATTVTRMIDGEPVSAPTLEFTREQKTGDTLTVSCLSCGATWDRKRFRAFAEALAATERGARTRQDAADPAVTQHGILETSR